MKKQTKRIFAGLITAPIWFIPLIVFIFIYGLILLMGYANNGKWNRDYDYGGW